MTWVVPVNEYSGSGSAHEHRTVKELRVSNCEWSFICDGPKSGISFHGAPIEDIEFNSQESAQAAIEEAAPWLLA